jgi:hypothetical protein
MVEKWGHFEGELTHGSGHHMYGYIGMSDRRVVSLPRPGSIVLVDASIRKIDDGNRTTEHDRPMYFRKFAMATAADGSIRTVRGLSCSLTRFHVACRRRGARRMKQKS